MGPAYLVIGYMVFPATWSIFGWSRTKWHFIQYNISDIWSKLVKIPDIWSIFEAVDALGDLVDAIRAAGGRLGDLRVLKTAAVSVLEDTATSP